MNDIVFNNVKFYASHEVHQNSISIFKNDEYFKIWHDKSKKKITFKIKREFDFNSGVKIGCWECISHRQDTYGYPSFELNKKMILMHRFMYCVFNKININDIKGKIIRHRCDNRLCSNPNHLEKGSHKDNIKDIVDRDRSCKGEKNHFSKLTEIDILYIRSSDMDLGYLSEMYRVAKNTIRRIKKRQLWKHVEEVDLSLLDENIII
jgi:hypothetical protein